LSDIYKKIDELYDARLITLHNAQRLNEHDKDISELKMRVADLESHLQELEKRLNGKADKEMVDKLIKAMHNSNGGPTQIIN